MKPTPFDPATVQPGLAPSLPPQHDRPQTGIMVAPIPGGHTAQPRPATGVAPIPIREFDPALVRNIINSVLHLLAFEISDATKSITLINLRQEVRMLAAFGPSETEVFYTLYSKPFGHQPVSVIETLLPRIGARRRNGRSEAEIAPLVLDFMTRLAATIMDGMGIDALLATL